MGKILSHSSDGVPSEVQVPGSPILTFLYNVTKYGS